MCNQVITVTPGKTYTLSGSLKTSTSTVTLGVKNGAEVAESGPTFTTRSLTFTPSAASITVYVQTYKQQTGAGWVDSVSLTGAP